MTYRLSLFAIFWITFSTIAYADSDCNKADADCDSRGKSAIKIKRLFNINLGKWGGTEITSGETEAAMDGRRFCIIAYTERNPRDLDDYEIRFSQASPVTAENDYFLANGSGTQLPITLTISAAEGDAHQNEVNNFDLANTPLRIETDNKNNRLYRNCKNNEFVIHASVKRTDIFSSATTDTFNGSFTLTAQRTTQPLLTASVTFNIALEFIPVVQISGLQDMAITHVSGDNVQAEQKFCVFGFGTTKFEIRGESGNGSGQFLLSNGNNDIPYVLSIGSGQSNGNGSLTSLIESGDYIANDSWKASNTLLCDSGNSDNMRLRVSISDSNIEGKPAGLYKDTAYLIVAPI
ncbi:hypothetical protein [Endozoicomonas ascidiicola]|uniref:hypothetical protein n=1 Tax=Endozoicomonas ascidiicola TaxID=1698521 RepID=UPI000832ECFA|nr:hypothetical protein [Endozoicomonas ascidiicola]